MSELAYLQLLGFVLSPQYFDSPDRLALQKDGGPDFFFSLTARVDQFTWGGLTFRNVISANRLGTLHQLGVVDPIHSFLLQNIWFFSLIDHLFVLNTSQFERVFDLLVHIFDGLLVESFDLFQFFSFREEDILFRRFIFVAIGIHMIIRRYKLWKYIDHLSLSIFFPFMPLTIKFYSFRLFMLARVFLNTLSWVFVVAP